MNKAITLTIDRISDTDERECRINSTRQIMSILHEIAEAGTNAALYYSPRRDFIMTTILDVDEDGLWIEPGHSTLENQQVTASTRLTLVSSHDHVKVEFVVGRASTVTYDDRPAFFLPLPEHIYRLQRREYFRLLLPAAEHLKCTVIASRKDDSGNLIGISERAIPILDISCGGVGLACMAGGIDFALGATYTDCRIDLPDTGQIKFGLIVKNVIPMTGGRPGQPSRRAGCKFIDIDSHALTRLQRFITEKQREIAAATQQ